uniref:Uncharacterized protein n=1 Tax=Anopheles atroparvus TaxID=41427 RepID=A0AAG5CV51_ANOAO
MPNVCAPSTAERWSAWRRMASCWVKCLNSTTKNTNLPTLSDTFKSRTSLEEGRKKRKEICLYASLKEIILVIICR